MSSEIVLTAIITVAPGKWPRLNELFAASLEYMQDHEPGTLEFRVFRSLDGDGDGGQATMIERYASQAALEEHRSSKAYQDFFQTMQEEGILEDAPQMMTGRFVYGFMR